MQKWAIWRLLIRHRMHTNGVSWNTIARFYSLTNHIIVLLLILFSILRSAHCGCCFFMIVARILCICDLFLAFFFFLLWFIVAFFLSRAAIVLLCWCWQIKNVMSQLPLQRTIVPFKRFVPVALPYFRCCSNLTY